MLTIGWSKILRSRPVGTQTASPEHEGDVDMDANTTCPVCKLDYHNTMDQNQILCDKCRIWYHYDCVDLRVEPPENVPYFCPPRREALRLIPGGLVVREPSSDEEA